MPVRKWKSVKTISIYDYLSYREFLRDYYEIRKKSESYFSYRYMSYKLGMDHSLLVKILLAKRHLSEKNIPLFANLCGFTKREAEYFEAMVHYEKARSEKQRTLFLEKLLSLKGYRSSKIERYRYEYFQKWYYSAIRSLLGCYEFRGDYRDLAGRLNPAITVNEAKRAVRLLQKLNFIGKDPDGAYILTEDHVTTGEQWESLAIRGYQRETIKMSADSLDRDPKEIRDVSSLTLSVDREAFEDIREIIRECRASIVRRVDSIPDDKTDRVYQLNMQMIPLTRIPATDAKK